MDRTGLLWMLRQMLLARTFEEAAAREYATGSISGFLHLYPGEEAVAVGVLHAAEPGDHVVSTYREHVHALVRGLPAREIMAELMGKKAGVSAGMGGSMHLFSREHRFLGGVAIVGETFPLAIGAAYAVAYRRLPEAVICFFGDGAVNQGTFHESLNMAALWKLPVLFVCENNRYQIGTEIHRHSAVVEVYRRACAYGIPAVRENGMDVLAVHGAARRALERVRAGDGPQLLELETYRYRGHSMADSGAYRPAGEVEAYRARDPIQFLESGLSGSLEGHWQAACPGPDCIASFGEYCRTQGHLEGDCFTRLEQETVQEVQEALEFARQAPAPDLQDAWAAFRCNRRGERFFGREPT